MNETINLAIIFDFSRFIKSENDQKDIETQLSKFLLFLQIWRKNHCNEKRKLFVSLKIASQLKTHFYRQQYFSEFDNNVWREIRDTLFNLCSSSSLNSHTETIYNDKLEDHFLQQLQTFASDFYWDSNDLFSPSNITSSFADKSSHSMAITSRRNIALYVTPSYYPVIVESRNTLKAIINKFESHSIAFVWLSQLLDKPSDNIRISNALSLFNGCMIPFDISNSSISRFDRFHNHINSAHILSKHQLNIKRNSIFPTNDTCFTFSSNIKLSHIDDSILCSAYTFTSLNKINFEFVTTNERMQNTDFTLNLYFIISSLDILPFSTHLHPSSFTFKCLFDSSLWRLQELAHLKSFILYPVNHADDTVNKSSDDSKSVCIWQIFEPWYIFHSKYDDFSELCKITNFYTPSIQGLESFMKNYMLCKDSAYLDSLNPSKLKMEMGIECGDSINKCKNDDFEIRSEYKRWERLYNQFSMIIETEEQKLECFVDNHIVAVKSISQSDNEETAQECKSQIMLRVFLINKFVMPIVSVYVNDVIYLLRRLSLLQMPNWVGQLLRNDMIQHDKDNMTKQLRVIYDELCYPYPKSLESKSPSPNVLLKEKWCKQQNGQQVNVTLKRSFSTVSNTVAGRNIPRITAKRKQLAVHSFTRTRVSSLKSVKRCLFGNKSNDFVSRKTHPEMFKNTQGIVFQISSDSNSYTPEKSNLFSDACKFYTSNSMTNAFVSDISNTTSFHNVNETACFKLKLSPGVESCYLNSPALISCYTASSPCSTIKTSIITPDKKYKIDTTVWNTTPFKYYQLPPSLSFDPIPTSSPIKDIYNSNQAILFGTSPDNTENG